MKILCKYITTATQVHTGKCYFLGLSCENGKAVAAYNIETSGNAAAANQVLYHNGLGIMLPEPGIECTNGLYVNIDGNAAIYYSLG